MTFEYICKLYRLSTLQSVTRLAPGTTAQVWKLETDTGRYLLRTLRDRIQGELEWTIFRSLPPALCPAIFPTADGAPAAEVEGVWHQLQEYLDGDMPDPSLPGMAAAMARAAKELSAHMPAGLIHGDLGPWNMVSTAQGLRVVDFGAAREGDPYFDFASLFGGVINHTPEGQRSQICGEFLRELDCDPARLLTQLELWAEEGISRWTGTSEKMVARFEHALNWAKENLYEL